ncbi:MAG: hypothetical protein HQ557_15090 [Bacteroidetes bacterium]|nr:hypothetical protein [Bacteroidota bacterium]
MKHPPFCTNPLCLLHNPKEVKKCAGILKKMILYLAETFAIVIRRELVKKLYHLHVEKYLQKGYLSPRSMIS